MQKRLRFTFLIAALTASSIVAFQLYWVYYNYVSAREAFIATAINALDKSIQSYQLQQINLPTSLNAKMPTLTVFMRTIPNIDPFALDTPKSTRRFSAQFSTVAIDKQHNAEVRTLIARLLMQQLHKPLDLEALTTFYKKELVKDGINLPVKLISRYYPASVTTGEIAAIIEFYKSPVVVKAVINSQGWLFWHLIIPTTVSLSLILVSAGSLWYMGVIISRQLKLDRLKNDFISNITHELRTPITILRSSNEAITQFGVAADPEKLSRYTGINSAILDKLENEIERMLDISLPESLRADTSLEQVDIGRLIDLVIYRFNFDDKMNLKSLYGSFTTPVLSDNYRLDTILSNLIDNAIKYAGSDAHIVVSATYIKKGWQLSVSDNGNGIRSEDLPYIFDKFYRVSYGDLHNIKGYGLGLSLVKQLVESLNGTIRVFSQPGYGTTFEINFTKYE